MVSSFNIPIPVSPNIKRSIPRLPTKMDTNKIVIGSLYSNAEISENFSSSTSCIFCLIKTILSVELAKELNVTKQSVSNWENDNIQPSVEMLEKIANVFSVSIDYLLGNNPRECIDVSDLPAEVIAHIRLLIEDLRKTKKD